MRNKSLSIVILLTSECEHLKQTLDWLLAQFQSVDTEYIVVDAADININLADLALSKDDSKLVKIINLSDKLYQSIAELKNDVISYVSGKYMMMIHMAEIQGSIEKDIDISGIVKYMDLYNGYILSDKNIEKINMDKPIQIENPLCENQDELLKNCQNKKQISTLYQDKNSDLEHCQYQNSTLASYQDRFQKYIIEGDTDIAFLCLNVEIVLALSGWNPSIICGEDYELMLRICDMGSKELLNNPIIYKGSSIPDNGENLDKSVISIMPAVLPVCYQEIGKPVYQDMYYTYSYILGKYADRLKKWNLFDKAFQNRYKEAVYFGIEDYFVHTAEQMIGRSSAFFAVNNKTNPVVIIMNSSMCNGAMQSFAKGFADALIELKQATIVVDIDFIKKYNNEKDIIEQKINHLLTGIAECGCKAVVGFQTGTFARQMEDGDLWGNKVPCPKFNITFDHPLFISYYLMMPIKSHYICSQDEGYVGYIKEYYPTIKDSWHLPPGGILPKSKSDSLNKRKWDVTFVAVYCNYREGVAAVRMMEKEDRRLALKLMILLKNNPNTSASEGLRQVLDAEGIQLDKKEFVVKLHRMTDAVRAIPFYYREKIVKILVDAGIDIHVFSNTWNDCPYADNEHLIIHSDVSFEDGVEIMADSKISLNIMSWHKGGMTERIANAMLAGSICVTDTTSYLKKHFTDGKDIVFFSLEDIYSLPQKIKNLLADMDTASKIAANGKENALKHHTWLNRASDFLEILKEIFLNSK